MQTYYSIMHLSMHSIAYLDVCTKAPPSQFHRNEVCLVQHNDGIICTEYVKSLLCPGFFST